MSRRRNAGTANGFLQTFLVTHNARFTVSATEQGSAFVPYSGSELNKIFSKHHERVVGNDNTISIGRIRLQIQRQTVRFSMARCRVLVCEHLDGTISVHYGPHLLATYSGEGELLPLKSKERAA